MTDSAVGHIQWLVEELSRCLKHEAECRAASLAADAAAHKALSDRMIAEDLSRTASANLKDALLKV